MKTMDEIRALIADIRDPNGRCPTEPLWVALLQKVESVVRERDEARETTRATAKALSIASDGARAEAERADRAESALAALRAAPMDALTKARAVAEGIADRERGIACHSSFGPGCDGECETSARAIVRGIDLALSALAPAPPAALRPPETATRCTATMGPDEDDPHVYVCDRKAPHTTLHSTGPEGEEIAWWCSCPDCRAGVGQGPWAYDLGRPPENKEDPTP